MQLFTLIKCENAPWAELSRPRRARNMGSGLHIGRHDGRQAHGRHTEPRGGWQPTDAPYSRARQALPLLLLFYCRWNGLLLKIYFDKISA